MLLKSNHIFMNYENQSKKILLVNPPIEDFYQTKNRQQPLGLQYIKAVLDEAGHPTDILNCLNNNKKKNIPIPSQFQYLKQYYPANDLSPFKLFTKYHHFGLNFQEITKEIKNYHPSIIGISINFTPYVDMAIKIAEICKSLFPDLHFTALPSAGQFKDGGIRFGK